MAPGLNEKREGNGWVYFFNIEAGPHQFSFTHPAMTCRPLTGPPLGDDGSIQISVLAGHTARVRLICE